MDNIGSAAYKAAGVDVTAGYKSNELIKKHVEGTVIPGVLGGLGGFGGMFRPDISGMDEPVLVSGTDGVGTKLKIAFEMDRHDTIGIDCVAMCVNDIVCGGAKPLFFLDYLAMGRNLPERVEKIVSGVAEGCRQAGCALIGGETAEMPGFYPENEYDLAGFAVGIVDRVKIIDGRGVKDGDAIIGIASSGVHSNGFSLIRKVLGDDRESLEAKYPALSVTVGEELLKPTKIYVGPVLHVASKVKIKAVSHITGGGFYENIPRMLPDGIRARINKGAFPIHAIFDVIQQKGSISEHDMYNTFNMGIGLAFVVDGNDAGMAMQALVEAGERAYLIGGCVNGERGIDIW
ncbi:MAG: phosphoribosylformylglycinamidine cyclo-ligase [Oscillospiraceae bacterium]|nr:phosphoribosylformylglycinamidine cyclo-ligase [Oscillospiraceae bacterium]